ncbi:MAG TPA: PD-(D/E)XK nuclease-like domain-containing protein, partial [Terracidiphilus sp.]|nr:PD-(D/E)XK nuclease-like domain-containing protein [Terracidiphilus sp.]
KDAFYVRPEGMKFSTKEGMSFRDSHQDRPILSHDEAMTIQKMVDAVHTHPSAKRLFSHGKAEQSVFVEDSHGTLRKSRMDWISEGGNVLPDLKTCESARAEDFEKSIWQYRYFVQAAYYIANCKLAGLEKSAFAFVCVEKNAPYAVACYSLDETAIEAGKMMFNRDLAVYRQCVESGKWPGYPTEILNIGLPAWSQKLIEQIV